MACAALPNTRQGSPMETRQVALTCPHCGLVDTAEIPRNYDTSTEVAVSACTRCLKPSIVVATADGDPMLRLMNSCEAVQIIASQQYMAILNHEKTARPVLTFGVAEWIANTIQEHERVHGNH
jgi:hypothetical protein